MIICEIIKQGFNPNKLYKRFRDQVVSSVKTKFFNTIFVVSIKSIVEGIEIKDYFLISISIDKKILISLIELDGKKYL
jgi:hypothetical protein